MAETTTQLEALLMERSLTDTQLQVKRTLVERSAGVRDILALQGFISEGIYVWWVDELLRSADVIVWLDIPFRVAARRIVVRHVRASLAGTNQHPGVWRLVAFLRNAYRYYAEPLSNTPAEADDDGAIMRLHTARELGRYARKVVRQSSARRPLLVD
jgi:hypothetical protein